MHKPNVLLHNPSAGYISELVKQGGLTQQETANHIGISLAALKNYMTGVRVIPYPTQYALEGLAHG